MASMPWLRLYSEIIDDKKIKRICRSSIYNKVTVIGVWVCLLALASESEERGKLIISEKIPYNINDLSCETEMNEADLELLIQKFIEYEMLELDNGCWSIKNWDNRQFKSDNVAERVAKHREKRKQEEAMERYSNVIDTDTDTEQNIADTEEDYIVIFCQITGIAYPFNVGTHAKWIMEVSEWVNLGINKDDIKVAYELAIEKKYTVARPGGLTNFLRGNVAKNNAKQADKKTYIGPDGEEIVL